MSSHTKEKPFKCDHCSFRTSCKRSLKCHTASKHEDKLALEGRPKFKCQLCTYKTYRSHQLVLHLRKHTDERNFPCKFTHCSYKAKIRGDLKIHCIRAHCNERPFSCRVEGCDYTAKTMSDARNHRIKHKNDRPFPCPHEGCGYKAKIKNALSAHLNFTHGNKWYKWSFPDCTFQTKRPWILKQHSDVHLDSFVCSFRNCTYRCRSKSALRSHNVARHEKTRPHSCPVPLCNFGTAKKTRLEDHLESHGEDRPFPCTFAGCNFRAKRTFDLKYHQETHNKEPKFPGSVPGCTYLARQKRVLTAHVKQHENFPYFRCCPEAGCNFCTHDSNSLWRHQNAHNRQSKFPCPLCPKLFTSKSQLEFHSFIHTGEKPYKCVHCDYGCYDKRPLAVHYERNHRGEMLSSEWLKPVVVCRHCSFAGTPDAVGRHTALWHLKLVVSLQRIRTKAL